jgi:phosphoglycolate phosphatase-like HAD superfamily hydrolase
MSGQPRAVVNARLLAFDLDGTLAYLDVDWADAGARIAALLEVDAPLTPLLPAIDDLRLDPERGRRTFDLIDGAELAAARSLTTTRALSLCSRSCATVVDRSRS